jgi:RNA polymerase sigma factor (sigma-70 family)
LVGYLDRRTGDQEEAEGLAHDVWLAYLVNWDRYQGYDAPAAPLFVIAKRAFADWCKARGREVPAADEEIAARLLLAHRPLNVAQAAGARIDLLRAMARLTPRQREALALRYVDDLDRKEVARLMGITVDGVKKLVGDGLARLRRAADLAGYPTTPAAAAAPARKEGL